MIKSILIAVENRSHNGIEIKTGLPERLEGAEDMTSQTIHQAALNSSNNHNFGVWERLVAAIKIRQNP